MKAGNDAGYRYTEDRDDDFSSGGVRSVMVESTNA